MSLMLALVSVALFSGLAFWKPNGLLFMLIAGGSLMLGLTWYDTYSTDLGLSVGMVMIGYALACLGFGLKCLLWRPSEDEE
jgi:hypothetical protein